MIERWKHHPVYTAYCISTSGRVYSGYTEKLLEPQNNHGYLQLFVRTDTGQYATKGIHRLVAETFIPNPECLNTVNHIDNDPTNNKVANLEWLSHAANVRHSQAMVIEQRDLSGNILATHIGFKAAAKAVGRPAGDSNICKCCKGERRTAYGYIWTYLEEGGINQ